MKPEKKEKITEETITISIKEYNSLKEDQVFLQILESHGVDNWSGYEGSVEFFQSAYQED